MIAVMVAVYRKFMRYGGTKAYLAPGDEALWPSPHVPPAHMTQIIFLYAVGAMIGAAAGYLLGFLVQLSTAGKAGGVSLRTFHTLIMADKDVRNMTTLCLAAGVIPFAILGGWAGTYLARRKPY